MGFLTNRSLGIKIMVLIALMVAGISVGSVVAIFLIGPIFKINILANPDILSGNNEDPQTIIVLKFVQLIQSAFVFIIPANLFSLWSGDSVGSYLGFNRTKLRYYLLAVLLIVLSAPVITSFALLNEKMVLPDFLKGVEEWMKSAEASAQKITDAFLNVNDFAGLLINILVIALAAAVGEELIFRGIIQRLIIEKTKNIHWGVWISAFIFSAVHMQFFGFLPRMILGVILGYVFVWSGSIGVPILAHFVNNAVVVIGDYLYRNHWITMDINDEKNINNALIIFSFLITLLLVWYFHKERIQKLQRF